MTFTFKTAASAIALSLVLGSGSAFAKAHDQGIADGGFFAGQSAGGVTPAGGSVVSGIVSGGQRGAGASANGGDNRTVPVAQPGLNEPS